MVFLETERLLLRTHKASDEADFIRMNTDAEVRRFMGGQAWSIEKAQRRFRSQYLGKPKRTYGLWATIQKEGNRYIGCCGLRTSRNRSAYLTYVLARPYWGRGLASEVAAALIDAAFVRLRLTRLRADVEQGHEVSEHILMKFGFKFVRRETIPQSNRIIDFYELERTNWKR
jgi:[ribosomal protein S5]-alanine N-acetyltransferase